MYLSFENSIKHILHHLRRIRHRRLHRSHPPHRICPLRLPWPSQELAFPSVEFLQVLTSLRPYVQAAELRNQFAPDVNTPADVLLISFAERAAKGRRTAAPASSEVAYQSVSEPTTGFLIEHGSERGLALHGTLVNTAVAIERGAEFGLVLQGTPVNAAAVIERGPELGLVLHGTLVNAALVVEYGPELGLARYGTPANDPGHAYEIEESGHTVAAASLFVLAGMAVRKCEGVRLVAKAA